MSSPSAKTLTVDLTESSHKNWSFLGGPWTQDAAGETPRPGTPAPHTVKSNLLSVKDDMQHLEWLKKAKEDQNITPTIFEKITWKNANRVLGLNLS